MTVTLPISRLVQVNVTLTPQAAQSQALTTMLIVGSSDIINVTTRMRSYSTLAAVAADFGTSAPEYLAAVLWFEQNPQPTQLFIGRWAQSATEGHLIGAPLTSAQQAVANWTPITDGGFTISINGGGSHDLAGLNFSTVTNMNAVAAVIQAALTAASLAATCVWNAVYNYFVISSTTTGASSSVSFATAGTGGGVTDVSAQLGLTVGSTGSFVVAGIAAESALTAVTILDTQFGQQWYAVTVLGVADADHEVIAPYIEGTSTKHYYGVTTQESTVLTPSDTSDIAYILSAAGYKKTGVQYSSTNPYAVVSMLARILTTDYSQNNSVIALMYKQEPGITPESLNTTQIQALEAKNCNVFVAYNNNTAIIEPGVSSSGDFIDTVMGADALAVQIQTAVYNLLYTSTTKIPQTDAGMHLITTAISNVCAQFVANGLLAPGTWNSQGFGSLNTGDPLTKGYYIYAAPIVNQSEAQRAARVGVPIQVAAKLAGAVQTVDVAITVNS